MIEGLRSWILSMLAISTVLTVMMTLLPEGSIKKIAGVTGGLALILVLLQGIAVLQQNGIPFSSDSCADEINRQIELYQEKNREETQTRIEEKCSAYIAEQAQALGLHCSAQVETEWTAEEIPMPICVTMDIPYDERLSDVISQQLGIDAAHQHWQDSER